MIDNYNNYGIYAELAKNEYQEINTKIINSENIQSHCDWILNIFKDGIGTDKFIRLKLRVTFADDYTCSIYISDYLFNLYHWTSIVAFGDPVCSRHIYFPENMTMPYNRKYINTWTVAPYYGMVDKIFLNNAINKTLRLYKNVNLFSFFLCNTIALEDDLKLMKENPRVYEITHCDLSGYSLEETKEIGLQLTKELKDIIYNDPHHCFGEMFRTGVGINLKQYKENCVNVGPKPNGEGGIYSAPVNSNLMYQAGLSDLMNMIVEYSVGRQAQIINQNNVGTSGHFARILKLNSMDTFLHSDPDYICDTKNFLEIELKNDKLLKLFSGMTYRTNPDGIDYVLNKNDTDLIGKRLFFRSAMTCASHARGDGICHCCYGRVSYVNSDVNIGIMAAELLSSILTQMLLSAKHLLEAVIKSYEWTEGFWELFCINCNEISLRQDIDLSKYYLIINVDDDGDIFIEEDYDNVDYNQFMTEIKIQHPNGTITTFETSTGDHLYLSDPFNEFIRKSLSEADDDGILKIPLNSIKDITMFLINIANNQLSDTLNKLQKILNSNAETSKYDKNQILQTFMETIIDSNINIQATHCAIILSNQIRSREDALLMPRWEYPNEPYQILSLNGSLKKSPSVVKSLLYSYVDEMMYSPISFRKTKASSADLVFMPQPQKVINNAENIIDTKKLEDDNRLRPGIIMDNNNKYEYKYINPKRNR